MSFNVKRAILSGVLARVEQELTSVVDINLPYEDRKMALHIAAENGYALIGKALLDRGANINAKNQSQKTALHIASELGYQSMVDLLLKNYAEVTTQDSHGQTALHIAARIGRESIVSLLLKDGGIQIDAQDGNGQTALHWACLIGQEVITKTLLYSRCNINTQDRNGQTALHIAAKRGYRVIINLLLKNGADVDAQDQNGHTALRYARDRDDFSLVEVLLGAGANAMFEYSPEQTFSGSIVAARKTTILYNLMDDFSFREQILSNFLTRDDAYKNRDNSQYNNAILIWSLLLKKEKRDLVALSSEQEQKFPQNLLRKRLGMIAKVQERLHQIKELDPMIKDIPTADNTREALQDIKHCIVQKKEIMKNQKSNTVSRSR